MQGRCPPHVHTRALRLTHTALCPLWPLQVVAEQLGGMLPGCTDVGLLTELRSRRVSRTNCAEFARQLGLQDLLVVGKSLWGE